MTIARGIRFGDVTLTDYPFMAEFGMDYAAGDLVTSVLSSFLQDGDLEVSQRRGNMTLTIPLLVEGSDLLELAKAEALLAGEAQKAINTLSIDPGDGFAPSTVFDTFEADVAFAFEDDLEIASLRRLVLTIRALPFGRSVDKFSVTGASTPTTVVVDNCSSATGWTGYVGSSLGGPLTPLTPTSTAGAVSATSSTLSGAYDISLSRAGDIDTSSLGYLVVDWKPESSAVLSGTLVAVDSSYGNLPLVAEGPSATAGYTKTTFFAPGVTTRDLTVRIGTTGTSRARSLSIDSISVTDIPDLGGTGRTKLSAVSVPGSARTAGELSVSSPTVGLGDTLVYTYPGDVALVPSMRRFYVDGAGLTAAAGSRSGFRNNLSDPFEFDVPGRDLTPGLYGLVAWVGASVGTVNSTISWTAQNFLSDELVGRQLTGTKPVTLTTTYGFVSLGTVNLPPTGYGDATSGLVRFDIIGGSSASSIILDDIYLLNLTTGAASMVRCGTGAPSSFVSSHLWLNAATVGSRTARILRGRTADGSDAYFAGDAIQAGGLHEFTPPTVKVFVSSDAVDAVVSLGGYARWLGHAAS